ncbi:hypothetical protein HZS_2049 [Henneguya salminicola]|nr:hypothetical protein HZS_2049 [Henneguya salminicola]
MLKWNKDQNKFTKMTKLVLKFKKILDSKNRGSNSLSGPQPTLSFCPEVNFLKIFLNWFFITEIMYFLH